MNKKCCVNKFNIRDSNQQRLKEHFAYACIRILGAKIVICK